MLGIPWQIPRRALRNTVILALCFSSFLFTAPLAARDNQSLYKAAKSHNLDFAASDKTFDTACMWWPADFAVQQTGTLNAQFDCWGYLAGWGRSGYFNYSPWGTPGFETPAASGIEYLFAGTFWIGGRIGSDTLVSVGMDGWTGGGELSPPEIDNTPTPNVVAFEAPSDAAYWSLCTDSSLDPPSDSDAVSERTHLPFPVTIANRSHVWRQGAGKDIIIYDMVIRNIGPDLIEDGYVGFYMDADVGVPNDTLNPNYAQDDLAGSLRGHGIAYAIDNDGDPIGGQFDDLTSPTKLFSLKIIHASFPITDTSFHWWISDVIASLDFGPTRVDSLGAPIHCDFGTGGTGTPEGDVNKYCLLSSGEWDYDQIFTGRESSMDSAWFEPDPSLALSLPLGSDTRFLYSVGPFTLPPDSSIRIVYSTFTADSVHTDPINGVNLGVEPDSFLAHLNFDNVIANAEVADSLGQLLLDPLVAPAGLRVADLHSSPGPTIEWDPFVYSGVDGYEIYLWEVPDDSLPYPGILAPWLRPPQLNHIASVGKVTSFVLPALDYKKLYLVNIAARSGATVGAASNAVALNWEFHPERVQLKNVSAGYLFVFPNDQAYLSWTPPSYPVQQYNVYRYEDSYARFYYPYYDRGCNPQVAPLDSFLVDGDMYYYNILRPYVSVAASESTYVDPLPPTQGSYIVTAIDSNGIESLRSFVGVKLVEPRENKVLLLINQFPPRWINRDSIATFYDSILSLCGYAIDVRSPDPSVLAIDQLYPYECVIIDDQLRGSELLAITQGSQRYDFLSYLYSGGRVASFGALLPDLSYAVDSAPAWYNVADANVKAIALTDSTFTYGFRYCDDSISKCNDTSLAFSHAAPYDADFPTLRFDSSKLALSPLVTAYWEPWSPPSVATFKPLPLAQSDVDTLYLYKGVDASNSLQEDQVFGLRHDNYGGELYLFGFYPWYMKTDEAAALFRAILDDDDISYCCRGLAGNVSDDYLDVLDIVDLTYLVCYMFKDCDPPRCYDEANIIDNANNLIDIVDLTYLVAFMFKGGPPPQACPAWPPLLKNP